MLGGNWSEVRRDPLPAALALLVGAVFGLGMGIVLVDAPVPAAAEQAVTTVTTQPPEAGTPEAPSPSATQRQRRKSPTGVDGTSVEPPLADGAPVLGKAKLAAAVEAGVAAAGRRGAVELGVWAENWEQPVLAGTGVGEHRVWSLHKPIVAVAIRQAVPEGLGAPARKAMKDAIRQSSNCASRRLVLGLQKATGGTAKAVSAVQRVLATADASAPGAQVGETTACGPWIEQHYPGVDADAPAMQFGVMRWELRDALAFVRALGEGRYGNPGTQVLRSMRAAKERSQEPGAELTAPPEWGMGTAFAAWRSLAWKAGWGGERDNPEPYITAQFGTLEVAGSEVAVAVVYRPKEEPVSADPGKTDAPQVLDDVLAPLADALRAAGGAR